MSKIHVLEAAGDRQYKVIIHVPVPTGNNAVGMSWKSVLLASGKSGTSQLTVGTGPGQISSAENAQIVAGDVIELSTTILAESGGAGQASIDAMVDAAIAENTASIASQYKYYGHTIG